MQGLSLSMTLKAFLMKQVVISVLGSVREDVLQAQIYTHGEQRQPPGCASISAHVCSYDRVYICLF